MIIKVFGMADLIAMIIFFTSTAFNFVPSYFVWIAGLYLVIKGITFAILLDIASIVDILSGLIVLLSIAIVIHPLLIAIVSIYLLQKGFMSLVG